MFSFVTETGWPMTTHSLGLGMPSDYRFGNCGRPVPGWNGKPMSFHLVSATSVCKKSFSVTLKAGFQFGKFGHGPHRATV